MCENVEHEGETCPTSMNRPALVDAQDRFAVICMGVGDWKRTWNVRSGAVSPSLQMWIVLSVEQVANDVLLRQSTSRVGAVRQGLG